MKTEKDDNGNLFVIRHKDKTRSFRHLPGDDFDIRESKDSSWGRMGWVDISDLRIDFYQRSPRYAHVKAISEKFDRRAFGCVVVSQRTNGSMMVLDGAHRVSGAKQVGEVKVPAYILKGLSVPEEALLWEFYNKNRVGVASYEHYISRLAQKSEDAVCIDFLCKNVLGVEVRRAGGGEDAISCPAMLMRLYAKHGKVHLEEMFGILACTWSSHTMRLKESVISSLSKFIVWWHENKSESSSTIEKFLRKRDLTKDYARASKRRVDEGGGLPQHIFSIWKEAAS